MINPADLTIVPEAFKSVPGCLRRFALEVWMVREKIKPAAFFHVEYSSLDESISFFRKMDLHVFVIRSNDSGSSFQQVSPAMQAHFAAIRRLKLCISATRENARTLSLLDECYNLYEIGDILGYPTCCVNATDISDQQQEQDYETAFNLRQKAIGRSQFIRWECNTYLDESLLALVGPTSLLAHYPCSLECTASVDLATLAYDLCASYWPEWAGMLRQLLHSPIVYFPAIDWSADYRDDTCGMCFVNGCVSDGGHGFMINDHVASLKLGIGSTPYGQLPEHAKWFSASGQSLTFINDDNTVLEVPSDLVNTAWLLNWDKGNKQRL